MDITQIFLIVTLSVTTIFLIVVGVYLVLALWEFKKALGRVNAIIEGFEKVSGTLGNGMHEVLGFITGTKVIFQALETFNKKKHEKQKKQSE